MSTSQFGRYEIKSELGRGGMATVFRAYDPFFKREVALKVLPREFLHDPQFRARFEREAQVVAALEHAAIVPVYDYGEEDGQPYLVMRLMAGGSLADKLRHGALSLAATLDILERLAPALDRAHGQGIVHRDLKPANILFDADGHPYISDFGLAKLVLGATQISQTGIMGTPAYMAPEQARGEKVISTRADIYALGVIIFHMLTGQLPFEADTPMGMAFKHITEPPPRLKDVRPDLPAGCDAALLTALSKDPDSRFATASALYGALQAAGATAATQSPAPPPPPAIDPPTQPMTQAAPAPPVQSPSYAPTQAVPITPPPGYQPTQIVTGAPPMPSAPSQPGGVRPAAPAAPPAVAPSRPRSRWPLLLLLGVVGLLALAAIGIGGFLVAPLLFGGDPTPTGPGVATTVSPAATGSATAAATPSETIAPSPTPPATVGPGLENLAAGHEASASNLELTFPPARAVDGIFDDDASRWSAGAHSPQWIEIDLGAPASVWALRLYVDQSPAGHTRHLVYGRAAGEDERLLHEFAGETTGGDVLYFRPPFPWLGLQFIRVETVESPSWVAWREVEVFGRFDAATEPAPVTETPAAGAVRFSEIDKMPQVYVPAGPFVMGNDAGPADQQPAHKVELSAFWMDQLEVTNAMYAACVAAGLCSPPLETRSITRADYYANPEFAQHPVLFVNWFQAQNYCEWAGRRLPTEAEWEKAARGDDERLYPWGSEAPDPGRLNYSLSGYADTIQGGQYPSGASPYGALDMAGNAWEWVADWYDAGYYAVSPPQDPPGPLVTGCPEGDCKVLRGGSWDSTDAQAMSTTRLFFGPNDSRDAFTIRCAQSP